MRSDFYFMHITEVVIQERVDEELTLGMQKVRKMREIQESTVYSGYGKQRDESGVILGFQIGIWLEFRTQLKLAMKHLHTYYFLGMAVESYKWEAFISPFIGKNKEDVNQSSF